MPELPEVETICQGIKPFLLDQKIIQINIFTKNLRWPIPDEIQLLTQTKIISIQRRAKYLLLTTTVGTAILHLGMSGYLQLLPHNTIRKKHDHVEFVFENGFCLRLNDARRFGALLFHKTIFEHPLLKPLGPEPLSKNFNSHYLKQALKGKVRAVKLAIMDQVIVVGIGNIYANESLFIAKINPNRQSNLLSKIECRNLIKSVKIVLEKALQSGGTTLKDFKNSNGKPGYFQQYLKVYGREQQPCVTCGTLLCSNRLGQRQTIWCNHCQI